MSRKSYPIQIISSGVDLDFAYKNSYFMHYTNFLSFEKIEKDEYFRLSNVAKSCNDTDELGRPIYAMCFCRTRTEKVPFWLNYATTDDGIVLRMKYDKMNKLLKCFSCLYTKENGKYIEKFVNFKGYKVTCGCCEYVNTKFNKSNYFHKRKAWSYENEFRIVVELGEPNEDDLYIKLDNKLLSAFYKLLSPASKRRLFKKSELGISFNLISKYSHQIPAYLESLPNLSQKEVNSIKVVKNIINRQKTN